MLVELDVAVGNALHELVGHLGHLLSGLAHEAAVDEPLAHELLGELALGLALGELLLVAVGIEVARRVGSVDFVNQIDLATPLAELVLGVHEDEPALGSNLRTALEERTGVLFHLLVVLAADDALGDNLVARDVLVVSGFGLRGGGDDGDGELLVLLHAFGKGDATERAGAVLVLAPGATGKVAADNHLYAEALAFQTDGYHRVGRGEFPVGDDVGRVVEELGGNLVEHLSLEGDALGQDDVEGRDAVGSDHDHQVVVDVIDVADFAVIDAFLSGEVEVGGLE